MNRLTTSVLLIATAAAGFAAGWFFVGKTKTSAGPAASRAPAGTAPAALPPAVSAVTPPEFTQLNTIEECRAFLYSADQRFAGRHPFVLGAGRDFALRRWLEIDAESALQEAEHSPGHEYATEGFAADLFRVWLDLHVDNAIEAWSQANPVLSRNVRVAFLTALADKDPAKAFAVWQTPRGKSNTPWGDDVEEAIFRRWAQQDPRVAMENASGGGARLSVIDEWAGTKPAEALAYIRAENLLETGLRSSVLLPLLLQSDSAAAREALSKAGEREVESISRNWTERDPTGALHWAQSQPPDSPLVRAILGAVAGKIAFSDPERALQVLSSLPPANNNDPQGRLRDFEIRSAHREAFASLAATNPERARELILTHPDMVKRGALDGYLTYAFANDSAAGIEQCREWLANPALKEAATSAALMAFRWGHGAGARDPSVVIAALPELAEKVDSDVLSGWAKANPTGAAEFIAQRAAAGKPVEDLEKRGVIAEIAIARPEWTSVWLQRLPDAALQVETAHTLAANWAAFDPEAAGRWIDSLPDGPVRESALSGIDRRHASERDPFGGEE